MILRAMHSIMLMTAVVLAVSVAALSGPSTWLLHVHDFSMVSDNRAAFVRTVLFPHRGKWSQEIEIAENGMLVCRDQGKTLYEARGLRPVRFTMTHQGEVCHLPPGRYVATASWEPMFLGVPLRAQVRTDAFSVPFERDAPQGINKR